MSIDAYYAGWNDADAEKILAQVTEDVVIEDVPTGHVARGADAARTFVVDALAKTVGTTYELLTVLVDGDAYATEWIMQPVGIRGASVGVLRDGLIAANRDYWSVPQRR